MHKFESLQNDENRAQSADSSKDYRKSTAFVCPVRSTLDYFMIWKHKWKRLSTSPKKKL